MFHFRMLYPRSPWAKLGAVPHVLTIDFFLHCEQGKCYATKHRQDKCVAVKRGYNRRLFRLSFHVLLLITMTAPRLEVIPSVLN